MVWSKQENIFFQKDTEDINFTKNDKKYILNQISEK